MSGFSQYQNVFRVAKHDTTSSGAQSRGTKRNRQPVSCVACRTRKLKCNRQYPCLTCSKRGDAASCTYSKDDSIGREVRDEDPRACEAQLRLQKLEQIVTNLMKSSPNGSESFSAYQSPNGVTVDQRLQSLSLQNSPRIPEIASGGRLDVNGLQTNYIGATHWATILENIRGIQGLFESDGDNGEDSSTSDVPDGPDIILDTTQSLTLTDAFNSLPPRPMVDKLLSAYFHAGYLQTPILHRVKFLREYESFWRDPSSASFLWLSILFSALWIGTQVSYSDGQEGQDLRDNLTGPSYFTRAGQALIAGRYRNARPYSVEAMFLYAQCNYMQKEDPDADAWVIMGTSTRLALRMGYHRDPRHLANISPFEGEMRRRTFSFVETFDLLLSFQAGLPAIIHEEECDTEPPSNLFDEDFDEDCKTLPPSRPPTDPTPMLYYCYKSQYAKILKRVIRHALSLKKPSYEDTMKLDNELHEVRAITPPSLRMRPLSSSIIDQPYTILNRLNVDLMFQKSLCVLHRTYLSHDRSNPALAYSRKTCIDAALQLLKYQAELYAASQPGGRFFGNKWVLNSLSLHDFLLAAMITCLDLYESHNKCPVTSSENLEAQVIKYDALRLSREIWTSRRAFSRDARRASNVLAVMLSKVPRPNIAIAGQTSPKQLSNISQISSNEFMALSVTNSMGNPSLSTNGLEIPAHGFPMENYDGLDFNATDPLNAIFNECDNIDWGLVDQYLLHPVGVGDVALDWPMSDPSGLPSST